MYVIMKKLKLICICVFCFFPVLCLKGQDVDFSVARDGNEVIYKVVNHGEKFVLLRETYVDLGTGSHLFIRCKKPDGMICDYILPILDKQIIKVELGESYVRTIDISRYIPDGIIEEISAVASLSFRDEQGEYKIVRLVKEIP